MRPPSDRTARIGLAILALAIWSTFAAIHAHVKPADYYVFWEAARHWQAPYDPALITALEARLHITGAWPFVYPPTFLLVAWPFAQLPLSIAYPLWTGVSAALFIWAAAHLVKPAWATLVLFIVPPVVVAIAPAQTSLLVGAALIGGWLNLERRPAMAGLLFAVAACIKPQAAVLAPLLLFGHWRALRWAMIGGLGMVLASFVFGPMVWLEWAHAMTMYRPEIFDRVNPSALAPSPYLQAGLIILGLWLAWTWRNLDGLLIGTFCATPYAHQYDLAALAPIALSWIIDFRRAGWARATCGAGFLAGFVSTPAGGLVFVLGLAVAALLERRRLASAPPLPSQAEAAQDALG
jgi:multidrug transporter EmrE-like cation transporter